MGYWCVHEWQCPFQFLFDGELNGRLDRVQMEVKLLNLALRKGCQVVIRVSLPEGGRALKVAIPAACSTFFITNLATVTETGEPIAVLQLLRFAGSLPFAGQVSGFKADLQEVHHLIW